MKFSWGTGIALFYGLFVVLMLSAVMVARRHDVGLVQKNYYDLDLNYQAHLEKKQNAADLAVDVNVRFNAGADAVELQFPVAAGVPSGTIRFYRPTTVNDDFTVPVGADASGVMRVPASRLAEGRWVIEVDWQAGGKPYYKDAFVDVGGHTGAVGVR